jgi:3-phosphoshikimate 1-carboxyvinyltransferase
VKATVTLPGSKSQTNRALVLSALAEGECTIVNALVARDTQLMCDALIALGSVIDSSHEALWRVTPMAKSTVRSSSMAIDAGLAGTVMRFILPVAALAKSEVTIFGDERAKERPIAPLIKSLQEIGVVIKAEHHSLPITIDATGEIEGGATSLDASASSQFVSALLLTAPKFARGLQLTDVGPKLPSRPHIEMTIAMLQECGVTVAESLDPTGRTVWQVQPSEVKTHQWQIEPDLSNAAPFIGAALVTGGQVIVKAWPKKTTQAGDYLRQLIDLWGGSWKFTPTGLQVTGPNGLRGIAVDLGDYGELTPAVAAICALASAPSTLRNIGHLRGHESDRLAALVTNLTAVGVECRADADSLHIDPRASNLGAGAPPTKAAELPSTIRWQSFDDHRLATAGALMGLLIEGIEVDDISATTKTMNNFPALWQEMLTGVNN